MSKKTVFTKTGKGSEAFYKTPEELERVSGITGMTEDGISICADGSYQKIYLCQGNDMRTSNMEKVKGCSMLLRSVGVEFAFYEILEQKKVLLLVSVPAQSFSGAQQMFASLEKELLGNMYTFGITLLPQKAEEKLQLMHHLLMADVPEAKIDVSDYLERTAGWLTDVKLGHYTEKEDMLHTGEVFSSVRFLRRLSAEHAAKICHIIKEKTECRLLVTVYTPVSDQKVLETVQNNYIGYESLLYSAKRKKSGIGKLSEEKDDRRYVYAGIYFVVSCKEEAVLIQKLKELEEQIRPYRCEMESFLFYQKEMLQKLSLLVPWNVRQTMLMPSGTMVAMNPFYDGEQNMAGEDMGTKAELLSAFDTMLEGGRNERSGNIGNT